LGVFGGGGHGGQSAWKTTKNAATGLLQHVRL
jgi:hypothetical protein